MTVVATLEIPAEDFILEEMLSVSPGIQLKLEAVVPMGSACPPYVWVTGSTVEEIDSAFRADADIESFSIVQTDHETALIRVEWNESLDGLFEEIGAETGGTVLEATSSADAWTIKLRFPTHDDLSTFYRQCTHRGIPLEVQSIRKPELLEDAGFSQILTDTQRETLRIANEMGYFAVPREITLEELADELDISDTAVSQRLRRGLGTLLTATLSGLE